MKVGIFFGGPSREREISFAGGRTAYDNLDKSLFEPVLIFVDGTGRFRLVNPTILQRTSIREMLPQESGFTVYDESLSADGWGNDYPEIKPEAFKQHFEVAFLAMHGPDCEDGSIQGLFEWYKMPYTGPGLMGSAVGINKILQNELIALVNGQQKKTAVITRDAWLNADKDAFFSSLVEHLGLPVVVKAPHQGSSIGVAIVRDNNLSAFCRAVDQCFFTLTVDPSEWNAFSDEEKRDHAQRIANLDESIGYPVVAEQTGDVLRTPQALLAFLAGHQQPITLSSVHAEDEVLFEEFITGQEFSCGVIQDDEGTAIALPPTEVYNVTSFDFKSKYQSNTSRKRIPVEASLEHNRKIQQAVAEVFTRLGINVYSRIDGFLTPDGRVLLHDPNTIPGMSPASLIFKQMAEIGMNITNALTYLIRQSLRERIRTGKDTFRLWQMLHDLDNRLAQRKAHPLPEQTIGFGPTDENFAEAKKEYNRLAAEGKVKPVLIYTKSKLESHELPVHLMFKDTIEDLDAALHQLRHPLVLETAERARHIVAQYV
ncbi:D-alanine--D-alanine ligase [Nibrella saemangeumensis]|uniref:D-alanine--D-alanine ligase family protein n=1 Tax=Nibrella saemangeumensis TaxID=1084526 RepID=UPI0031EBFF82